MKLTKITSAAMALALAAALTSSAHAQVAYTAGDLILGFEQNGNASDYVVDLGAASQFIGASGTTTFNLSTADLNSIFTSTSNWASNSQTNLVQWGIIGGSSRTGNLTLGSVTLAKNTLFYTVGETTPGTQSNAPIRGTNSTQNSINGNIVTLDSGFDGAAASAGSTLSLQATIQSSAAAGSWSSFSPGGTAFTIGSSIEQPLSGSNNGPTNSVLDLYELPSSAVANQPGIYLGSFSLGSNGVLTFSAASVPEPSTYALMGLGLMILTWHLRRKVNLGV